MLRKDFKSLPIDFEVDEIVDTDWQNAYKSLLNHGATANFTGSCFYARNNIEIRRAVVTSMQAWPSAQYARNYAPLRKSPPGHRDAHADQLDTTEVIDAGCGFWPYPLQSVKKILGFDFDPEAITVCEGNWLRTPISLNPSS